MKGQMEDPQSQNPYSYARNDPESLIDPNGQLSVKAYYDYWVSGVIHNWGWILELSPNDIAAGTIWRLVTLMVSLMSGNIAAILLNIYTFAIWSNTLRYVASNGWLYQYVMVTEIWASFWGWRWLSAVYLSIGAYTDVLYSWGGGYRYYAGCCWFKAIAMIQVHPILSFFPGISATWIVPPMYRVVFWI